MRKVSELRVVGDAELPAGLPWSVALNVSAACDEVAVTLLTMDVVDDFLRLTGLLQVGRRPDVRLATVPTLEVAPPDGAPLPLVDARVLPHGRITWMSWTFERPEALPGRLAARIGRIQLEFPGGKSARIEVPGPWAFSLLVRPPVALDGTAGSGSTARRA